MIKEKLSVFFAKSLFLPEGLHESNWPHVQDGKPCAIKHSCVPRFVHKLIFTFFQSCLISPCTPDEYNEDMNPAAKYVPYFTADVNAGDVLYNPAW